MLDLVPEVTGSSDESSFRSCVNRSVGRSDSVIDLKTLVDRKAIHYIEVIDSLGIENSNTRYRFMDQIEYEKILASDPREGMKIYWYEILARCHISSISAVMRTRRWFSAIEDAVRTANLLAFSAAFRGLLESAADTSTSLVQVLLTIAQFHSLINDALSKRIEGVTTCKALEDELIHFTHARYIPRSERKKVPTSHRARSTKDYMDILVKGKVIGVDECYRTMCDLTHPGASSVWMWFDWNADEGFVSSAKERSIIVDQLQRHREMIPDLLMFGFNPAIVTLKVLNHFTAPEFHTPQINDWNLSSISLWRRCEETLRNNGPE